MAHPNEEVARSATEALSKGDMEGFLSHHTEDTVVHFPGRGPLAGCRAALNLFAVKPPIN